MSRSWELGDAAAASLHMMWTRKFYKHVWTNIIITNHWSLISAVEIKIWSHYITSHLNMLQKWQDYTRKKNKIIHNPPITGLPVPSQLWPASPPRRSFPSSTRHLGCKAKSRSCSSCGNATKLPDFRAKTGKHKQKQVLNNHVKPFCFNILSEKNIWSVDLENLWWNMCFWSPTLRQEVLKSESSKCPNPGEQWGNQAIKTDRLIFRFWRASTARLQKPHLHQIVPFWVSQLFRVRTAGRCRSHWHPVAQGGPLGASSHSGLWSAGSSDLDQTSLKFLRAIQNGDPE